MKRFVSYCIIHKKIFPKALFRCLKMASRELLKNAEASNWNILEGKTPSGSQSPCGHPAGLCVLMIVYTTIHCTALHTVLCTALHCTLHSVHCKVYTAELLKDADVQTHVWAKFSRICVKYRLLRTKLVK